VNQFKGSMEGMVVVQGPGELLLFDPATNKPGRHLAVGKQPHWLAVSGDGKTAYVTDEGSNDVALIDLSSGKMIMVPVGRSPRKVVVQPVAQQVPAAGVKVSISNFAFGPQATTVRAGESVTWSNDDGSPHTVTFKDGSAGSTGISPGQSFTRVFDRAGSYDYYCSFHPYMTARVTVEK
jgi:YVTN family beta-propeller protein